MWERNAQVSGGDRKQKRPCGRGKELLEERSAKSRQQGPGGDTPGAGEACRPRAWREGRALHPRAADAHAWDTARDSFPGKSDE